MSNTPLADIVRRLSADGVSADVIADVIAYAELHANGQKSVIDEASERRRAADRERQRARRASQKSADNPQTIRRQSADPSPPKNNIQTPPPTPPKSPDGDLPPRRKTACRLPDDWRPEPFPAEFHVDNPAITADMCRRELARFRDYWWSQPGARGRKADWQATWRNWCRRAADDAGSRGRHGPPGRVDPIAELNRIAAEGQPHEPDGNGRTDQADVCLPRIAQWHG